MFDQRGRNNTTMNVLSSLILSTVEVANLLPLVAVVICVGAMIMFLAKAAVILRVQADDTLRPSTIPTNPNVQVPRLKMTRVHIPFTFRLLETGNNSFEEVRLAVSSQVKYQMAAFWAVSIRELHMSLWRTWSELREQTRLSVIVDSAHCQQLATNMSTTSQRNGCSIKVAKATPSAWCPTTTCLSAGGVYDSRN